MNPFGGSWHLIGQDFEPNPEFKDVRISYDSEPGYVRYKIAFKTPLSNLRFLTPEETSFEAECAD